jgi:CDP-glucose 4,6-dehydratase
MEFRKGPVENLVVDKAFWQDRKVFITGHTGFKGGWLSLWLHLLGAKVSGYALEPPTTPSLFNDARIRTILEKDIVGDVRNLKMLMDSMRQVEPEIVIHMAAQSLVRKSYLDPTGTYETNVMGTVNLLESARSTPTVKVVLNITSDKCYENNEWVWGYRENDPMGGLDPYSSSKGCAELISSAYRHSFLNDAGTALATARAGNVLGGGDWAQDRIVPDAMRAFLANKLLMVRNPHATRPWQHVLEPLYGYILLCQQLVVQPEKFSKAWNFGPGDEDIRPVSVLTDILVNSWGDGVKWQQDEEAHPHEARHLKLDCSRARAILKWTPIWGIERTLDETVKWYKAWQRQDNMHDFTLRQIELYQQERLKL